MKTKIKKTVKVPKKKKDKARLYGNNLPAILAKLSMSSQELSDETGICPSHISKIINNQRKCISLPVAMKIAKVVKQPVEKIFNDTPQED